MAPFTYDSSLPVRDDIVAAHRDFWEALARPGTWWSGAERVAIVAEARRAPDCALCSERRAALSPHAIDGRHDHASELSEAAVDAIHRLVTDPARLTRAWLGGLADRGLSDAHYVELLGLVAALVSVDGFHRALGLPLEPLPSPRPGEPTRRRPRGLVDDIAWVPVLHPKKTEPAEADLFDSNQPGHIVQALSLVPDIHRTVARLHAAHYLPYGDVARPGACPDRSLTRTQIELVAARMSSLSECFY